MSNWTWVNWAALFNTLINLTAAAFIIAGVRAIKRGDRETHQRRMLVAAGIQALFLVLYLTRKAIADDIPFQGPDLWRYVYYLVLFPHLILAMVQLPLVIRAIYLGLKGRFTEHRRLVKIVTPIWLYVGFSGAVVFLMLHYPY